MCEEKQRLLRALDDALTALRQINGAENRGSFELQVKLASEALNRHVAEHQC
jgi:hypothetical protein